MPCRDCGEDVEATVLYRAGRDATGEPKWERRAPPILCDDCAEDDERAQRAISHPTETEADPVAWLHAHGVNTRKHGHATIANFDATDAPEAPDEARRFMREVLDAKRHSYVQGLYLVSQATGTGKSHLAVGIMRAVHELAPGLTMVYEPADRLVTRVQDSYGKGTTDDLIEARARVGLYVLDDLGREKATPDALRVLCTILDEREGHPTVITSNYLPHELGDRHDDETMWARVASRLGDNVYRYVAIDGRDRRFVA